MTAITSITDSFTAVGASSMLFVRQGRNARYSISGTFVATILVQKRLGLDAWQTIRQHTAAADTQFAGALPTDEVYRLYCISYTSGTVDYTLEDEAAVIEALVDKSGTVVETMDELGTRSGGTSQAELDYLDGAVAGTVVASKAVVVDANKDASSFRDIVVRNLDAGASGTAGTVDVFPSTASKGKLSITCAAQTGDTTVTHNVAAMGQATVLTVPDPGDTTASYLLDKGAQTISGTKTFSSDPRTSVGVGAVNGTGVTLVEQGNGAVHKTVFTFTNVDIALADEAGVVAYGSLKIYDMPAGVILMLGAVADLDLTKSSAGVNDDWDGDVGLGTAASSNNDTLSGTEQDIIPTTATPQAVAGVTTANGKSTATEAGAVFDGTATAVDVYLNLLVDDADHDVTGTPCNLIVNGTLTLTWINLGDY